MKSLDDAIKFIKEWDGAFDGRDKSRFAGFLPFERCLEAGLSPVEGMTAEKWGEVKPWTEEEVLKQLREDTEFGLEKAEGERAISSSAMFAVVNMWCELLENGLSEESYTNYGRRFFTKVLDHYGWVASASA